MSKSKIKIVFVESDDESEEKDIDIVTTKGKRYRILPSGEKRLVCKFEKCTNVVQKWGYCRKHETGEEKPKEKSISIVNEDGTITHSNQEFRNKCRLARERGDAAELFIMEVLKEYQELQEYVRIGNTNDKIDIKYIFKDENVWRGLQVKTIRQGTGKMRNQWSASECGKYDDNTLLVFVNEQRDKFGLIFSQDCPKTSVSLIFSNSKRESKYKDNAFTDIMVFKSKLILYMRKSIEYKENLPLTYLKEKESMLRLKNKCNDEKLEFKYSERIGSISDCYINGLNIQCKFTSDFKYNLYKCSVAKTGPYINGKRKQIPYNETDKIDFFIIETGKLKGQFFIIPRKEFINRGIFKSKENKGILSIYIPLPGYETKSKYKWVTSYLDRWDLLK